MGQTKNTFSLRGLHAVSTPVLTLLPNNHAQKCSGFEISFARWLWTSLPNIQQCWELLANNVASVCTYHTQRLPTLLPQQCWELLCPYWQWCTNGCDNSQQHAIACNRVCKRTQHVTSNNVRSYWPTKMRPFARGLTSILHRNF